MKTSIEITTVEAALMEITEHGDFKVMYFPSRASADAFFPGMSGYLVYDFEDDSYTLLSHVETIEEKIIKVAKVLANGEMPSKKTD